MLLGRLAYLWWPGQEGAWETQGVGLKGLQKAAAGLPACRPWPDLKACHREVISNSRWGLEARPSSPTSTATLSVTTSGGQQVAGELWGALT